MLKCQGHGSPCAAEAAWIHECTNGDSAYLWCGHHYQQTKPLVCGEMFPVTEERIAYYTLMRKL